MPKNEVPLSTRHTVELWNILSPKEQKAFVRQWSGNSSLLPLIKQLGKHERAETLWTQVFSPDRPYDPGVLRVYLTEIGRGLEAFLMTRNLHRNKIEEKLILLDELIIRGATPKAYKVAKELERALELIPYRDRVYSYQMVRLLTLSINNGKFLSKQVDKNIHVKLKTHQRRFRFLLALYQAIAEHNNRTGHEKSGFKLTPIQEGQSELRAIDDWILKREELPIEDPVLWFYYILYKLLAFGEGDLHEVVELYLKVETQLDRPTNTDFGFALYNLLLRSDVIDRTDASSKQMFKFLAEGLAHRFLLIDDYLFPAFLIYYVQLACVLKGSTLARTLLEMHCPKVVPKDQETTHFICEIIILFYAGRDKEILSLLNRGAIPKSQIKVIEYSRLIWWELGAYYRLKEYGLLEYKMEAFRRWLAAKDVRIWRLAKISPPDQLILFKKLYRLHLEGRLEEAKNILQQQELPLRLDRYFLAVFYGSIEREKEN